MSAVAVINLGLGGVRCIVFDPAGRVLASAWRPVRTCTKGCRVEQDPQEWWDRTVQVVREATATGPVREALRYLTVTASASCLLPVGRDGRPLTRAIMVSDRRAVRHAEQLEDLPAFWAVKARTGMKASADLYLPKILWLKEHRPEVARATWKYLSPSDYLLYRCTGEAVTDSNSALKFHLCPHTARYPVDLLEDLEIAPETLPGVLRPGVRVGPLTPEAAARFGVGASVEVLVGTYDALCAVVGSGVSVPGEACDVSGTVTSVRLLTRDYLEDPLQRVFLVPWAGRPRTWLAGGSNNCGGGLVEWAREVWLKDVTGDPYAVLAGEARRAPAGARGLLFLPYLLGERAPVWDPDARGVFFGLEGCHSRGDMLRAICEAAAYSSRHILEVLQSLGAGAVERVYLSGGLARIAAVSQIKADILGVPTVRVREHEASALGAAILAYRSLGVYASDREAAGAMVATGEVFEPNARNHALYNEWFERYKELYLTLKDFFRASAGPPGGRPAEVAGQV
jgi:xylulokinase